MWIDDLLLDRCFYRKVLYDGFFLYFKKFKLNSYSKVFEIDFEKKKKELGFLQIGNSEYYEILYVFNFNVKRSLLLKL